MMINREIIFALRQSVGMTEKKIKAETETYITDLHFTNGFSLPHSLVFKYDDKGLWFKVLMPQKVQALLHPNKKYLNWNHLENLEEEYQLYKPERVEAEIDVQGLKRIKEPIWKRLLNLFKGKEEEAADTGLITFDPNIDELSDMGWVPM